MELVANLVGFVLAALFGGWIFSFVLSGVRTGKIHHTDSNSKFTFCTQPIRFTLVALLFTTFSLMLFYFAVQRAIDVWEAVAA